MAKKCPVNGCPNDCPPNELMCPKCKNISEKFCPEGKLNTSFAQDAIRRFWPELAVLALLFEQDDRPAAPHLAQVLDCLQTSDDVIHDEDPHEVRGS